MTIRDNIHHAMSLFSRKYASAKLAYMRIFVLSTKPTLVNATIDTGDKPSTPGPRGCFSLLKHPVRGISSGLDPEAPETSGTEKTPCFGHKRPSSDIHAKAKANPSTPRWIQREHIIAVRVGG